MSKPPASPIVLLIGCPEKTKNSVSMVFPLIALLDSSYFQFKEYSETDVICLSSNPKWKSLPSTSASAIASSSSSSYSPSSSSSSCSSPSSTSSSSSSSSCSCYYVFTLLLNRYILSATTSFGKEHRLVPCCMRNYLFFLGLNVAPIVY